MSNEDLRDYLDSYWEDAVFEDELETMLALREGTYHKRNVVQMHDKVPRLLRELSLIPIHDEKIVWRIVAEYANE